mmetsp:Transcript_137915/g.251209  ORF Transcript_137915/g.251209 Transcript_137915/m.251209 type:complete len:207 (+) Transcript_137915:144-764(+)
MDRITMHDIRRFPTLHQLDHLPCRRRTSPHPLRWTRSSRCGLSSSVHWRSCRLSRHRTRIFLQSSRRPPGFSLSTGRGHRTTPGSTRRQYRLSHLHQTDPWSRLLPSSSQHCRLLTHIRRSSTLRESVKFSTSHTLSTDWMSAHRSSMITEPNFHLILPSPNLILTTSRSRRWMNRRITAIQRLGVLRERGGNQIRKVQRGQGGSP